MMEYVFKVVNRMVIDIAMSYSRNQMSNPSSNTLNHPLVVNIKRTPYRVIILVGLTNDFYGIGSISEDK